MKRILSRILSLILSLLLLLLSLLPASASAPISKDPHLELGLPITSYNAYLAYHRLRGIETPPIPMLFGDFVSFTRLEEGSYRYRYDTYGTEFSVVTLHILPEPLGVKDPRSFEELKTHLTPPLMDEFGEPMATIDLIRLQSPQSGIFRIKDFIYTYETGILQSIRTGIDGYTLTLTADAGFEAFTDYAGSLSSYLKSQFVEDTLAAFPDVLAEEQGASGGLLLTDEKIDEELTDAKILPPTIPPASRFEALGEFVACYLPRFYSGDLSSYLYILSPTSNVSDWIVLGNCLTVPPTPIGYDEMYKESPPLASPDSLLTLSEQKNGDYYDRPFRYFYVNGSLVWMHYVDVERRYATFAAYPACGFSHLPEDSPLHAMLVPATSEAFFTTYFAPYQRPAEAPFPYAIPIAVAILIAVILLAILLSRRLFAPDAPQIEPTPIMESPPKLPQSDAATSTSTSTVPRSQTSSDSESDSAATQSDQEDPIPVRPPQDPSVWKRPDPEEIAKSD